MTNATTPPCWTCCRSRGRATRSRRRPPPGCDTTIWAGGPSRPRNAAGTPGHECGIPTCPAKRDRKSSQSAPFWPSTWAASNQGCVVGDSACRGPWRSDGGPHARGTRRRGIISTSPGPPRRAGQQPQVAAGAAQGQRRQPERGRRPVLRFVADLPAVPAVPVAGATPLRRRCHSSPRGVAGGRRGTRGAPAQASGAALGRRTRRPAMKGLGRRRAVVARTTAKFTAPNDRACPRPAGPAPGAGFTRRVPVTRS